MGKSPFEIKLIENAQKGETHAFELLLEQCDNRIMSLLIQMLGNVEDAQDAYQEVCIRLWKSLPSFRFESDFFTWVYRITFNTSISQRKKRQKHKHYSIDELADNKESASWHPEDAEAKPDQIVTSLELGNQIEKALSSLSMQQRASFILRYYQEFKINEIALIMDCTEGTVKNYLFRATRKLRKLLKPEQVM
jgi:RNA polymerase sigma-70 factor (ECF subfamily)